MSRPLSRWCLATALAMVLAGTLACGSNAAPPLTDEQRQLNLESFDHVWTTIRDKYYDPDLQGLDWDGVREELRPKVEQAETMNEARRAMDDMINRFEQSHFNIIPDEVYVALGPSEGAIDGVTGIDARVVDGVALVTKVEAGSPAATAGVQPGWVIASIDGNELGPQLEGVAQEYDGRSWKEGVLSSVAVVKLRGPVGEKAAIQFLDGDDRPVDLEIDRVEARGDKAQMGFLPPMHVWADSDVIEGDIGYIAFNMWLHPVHVMPVVNEAMQRFIDEGVEGVIIDLRGNGGGLPEMAMGVAGWFVSEKDKYLGTVTLRDTELKIVVRPRFKTYDGPLAILVDEMSGSCSEMFSGGMQDIDRATIVGRRTMGAALPSMVEKLSNGDGFQYAFANYESADGEMLEGVGVVPDIAVTPSREDLLAGHDPALERAVAWIRNP